MTDMNRPMMYGQEVWADAETVSAPIQRHEPRSPLCGNRCGRLVPNENGSCVLYADHAAVLARAEAQVAAITRTQQRQQELCDEFGDEVIRLHGALRVRVFGRKEKP